MDLTILYYIHIINQSIMAQLSFMAALELYYFYVCFAENLKIIFILW